MAVTSGLTVGRAGTKEHGILELEVVVTLVSILQLSSQDRFAVIMAHGSIVELCTVTHEVQYAKVLISNPLQE